MRALHAINSAIGRRDANRAALIAADGQIHFARSHQRCAAGGRAAGGITFLVGIVHGAGGTGVGAAGEAKIFAHRLADDGRAGVEQARDDRRIDVGNVTFECRCAIHHRHARDTNVVFDCHGFTGELALRRAFDGRLVIPRAIFVLVTFWAIARRARIFHLRKIIGRLVDHIIGIEITLQQGVIGFQFLGR